MSPAPSNSVHALTVTPMVVEIDRIKPYDRNPRREVNPRYDDIKASIRAQRGLNNPLTITRRPGEDRYMVESGGNTRLLILQELWGETRDEAFYRIHCLVVPWRSESHVLTAHLIENELRGEMMWIDKALALRDLKAQIEQETGRPLSRNEFLRRLADWGYRLSKRQLIRYDYTVDELEPMIPRALRAGLGRSQLDQIRAIQKAYRTFYDTLPAGRPAFEPLFFDVLATHDDEHFDLAGVRGELDRRMAQLAGRALQPVRMQLDALLYGQSPIAAEETETETTDEAASSESEDFTDPPLGIDATEAGSRSADPISEPGRPPLAEEREPAIHADAKPGSGIQRLDTPQPTRGEASPPSHRVAAQAEPPHSEGEPFLAAALNGPKARLPRETDLKSLRSRCYVLALRVAQSFGFQALIRPGQSGHGFFIELPEVSIQDETHWYAWWLLFSLSEQAVTVERLALGPAGMKLPELLRQERHPEVYGLTGVPPKLSLLPYHLLLSSQLSERGFHDLLLLMESCRILRMNFRESDLWECLTVEQVKLRAQLAARGKGRDG